MSSVITNSPGNQDKNRSFKLSKFTGPVPRTLLAPKFLQYSDLDFCKRLKKFHSHRLSVTKIFQQNQWRGFQVIFQTVLLNINICGRHFTDLDARSRTIPQHKYWVDTRLERQTSYIILHLNLFFTKYGISKLFTWKIKDCIMHVIHYTFKFIKIATKLFSVSHSFEKVRW